MGLDAHDTPGNPNRWIGRDAYGMSLNYYGDADYTAIDDDRWDNTNDTRPIAPMGGDMDDDWQPLFNGNIAHTVNTLAPFGGYPHDPIAPGQVLAMVHRYDQLNRLKISLGYVGLDDDNDWGLAGASTPYLYRSFYEYDPNGNIDTVARYDQFGVQYDAMRYGYHVDANDAPVRNRLYHITEWADDDNTVVNQTDDGFEDYPSNLDLVDDEEDFAGLINTDNNYSYDALGNLIRDELSEIELIQWTVAGKVASVDQEDASGKNDLQFSYGAGGQRTMKDVQDDDGQLLWRDHYVRDAQGNVMAHYRYTPGTGSLKVRERPLYGSSRLGVDDYQLELGGMPLASYDPMQDPAGMLRYELTDHLGNVTTVITDELLGVNTDADAQFEYFQPMIVSAQGYEPFGGLLPGRNYSSGAYRFSFQGMEKDDELHGSTGTSYDFGARLYDARVGRWLSLDPLAYQYANLSPYNAMENNPIYFHDPTGRDAEITISGNTITISTTIFIYGTGASAEKAKEMQDGIMGVWGGSHTYKDPETGVEYNVKFDISVKEYHTKDPYKILELKYGNGDNYVEVKDKPGRSHVDGEGASSKNEGSLELHRAMKTGIWFTQNTRGMPDDASPHELGHLFGLSDRYDDIVNDKGGVIRSEVHEGFEESIMGGGTEIFQVHVDAIVGNAVKAYNASWTKAWNDCSICPGTVDYEYIQTSRDHEPTYKEIRVEDQQH